ncbi:MAG: ABC transporter permease [Bacteroidota bacterium]|nr:ABC transporter permease [Bacteroidota bacterium]
MSKMCAIYKRDLSSYFSSPTAYILIGIYLLTASYFFCISVFGSQTATMEYAFMYMFMIFLVISPILTMRLIAEEKKLGTDQLLLTSPLRIWDIVLGKFFAALTLYAVMMAVTLIFPAILYYYSKIDLGPVITGYIGLFLMGGAFISVGLFASSLTENQIISGIISFVILLLSVSLEAIATFAQGTVQALLNYLSLMRRFYENFQVGILDAGDVFYYLSFMFIFLLLTVSVIQRYRWTRG